MQPPQPKKFFDISPGTPSNIIRPTIASNLAPAVPAVRKISINVAPIQKPPSDLFKPLSSVMPVAPAPVAPPPQTVSSVAPLPAVATQPPLSLTPATEVPKFGNMQSKVDAHPLFSGQKDIVPKAKGKILSKVFWIVGIILVILAGIYVAMDSGAINTNINLPFHIFSQSATVSQSVITPTQTVPSTVYEDTATKFINSVKSANKTSADGLETIALQTSTKTSAGTTSFYDACQKTGVTCTSFFESAFTSSATKTTKDYKAQSGVVGKEITYTKTQKNANSSSVNSLVVAVVASGDNYLVDFVDISSDAAGTSTPN